MTQITCFTSTKTHILTCLVWGGVTRAQRAAEAAAEALLLYSVYFVYQYKSTKH